MRHDLFARFPAKGKSRPPISSLAQDHTTPAHQTHTPQTTATTGATTSTTAVTSSSAFSLSLPVSGVSQAGTEAALKRSCWLLCSILVSELLLCPLESVRVVALA